MPPPLPRRVSRGSADEDYTASRHYVGWGDTRGGGGCSACSAPGRGPAASVTETRRAVPDRGPPPAALAGRPPTPGSPVEAPGAGAPAASSTGSAADPVAVDEVTTDVAPSFAGATSTICAPETTGTTPTTVGPISTADAFPTATSSSTTTSCSGGSFTGAPPRDQGGTAGPPTPSPPKPRRPKLRPREPRSRRKRRPSQAPPPAPDCGELEVACAIFEPP